MSTNNSSSQLICSNDDDHDSPATPHDPPSTSPTSPRRFIYNTKDMQQFRSSPTRRELLAFVTALGRSTITSSYIYDPKSSHSSSEGITHGQDLLLGLSPGMASLHGSLRCMAEEWVKELPPDKTMQARFGNPMFKAWCSRLTGSSSSDYTEGGGGRSRQIVLTMMECHMEHTVPVLAKKNSGTTDDNSADSNDAVNDNHVWDVSVLKKCSEAGYRAAQHDNDNADDHDRSATTTTIPQQDAVLHELQAYLNLSFGHPIRIDYGTGHESSFIVFLYSLCKVGIFGNDKSKPASPDTMAPVALSILTQYLHVCRGIQTDYMLEPAGSHGVWGLDDYHCIAFYVGACQLMNKRYTESGSEGMKGEGYLPSDIHGDHKLASQECQGLMYFQCIRYVKSLKRGVPFFESSPMLDDISRLSNWDKISAGLLRLYEGEVLDKLPVVQHFVFGGIFKATWTPSEGLRSAPSHTFNDTTTTNRVHLPLPPTRAPWAK